MTLYGLASGIACDLSKNPKSIEELREKYHSACQNFLFERAIGLLTSLSKVCQMQDGRLCAKRGKISSHQLYLAALN